MTSEDLKSKLSALKPELAKRFGVKEIGFFGSYARGEDSKDSDIDILVEFSRPIGWSFFDLKDFLEDALEERVDLGTKKALKPRIKDKILQEVIYS